VDELLVTCSWRRISASGARLRGFTLNGSWGQQRRMVAKAEHFDGKSNPRFVVTSLDSGSWDKQIPYKELYCARGDMENRIKEQFVLFAESRAPIVLSSAVSTTVRISSVSAAAFGDLDETNEEKLSCP
jgi:hypothetical protein